MIIQPVVRTPKLFLPSKVRSQVLNTFPAFPCYIRYFLKYLVVSSFRQWNLQVIVHNNVTKLGDSTPPQEQSCLRLKAAYLSSLTSFWYYPPTSLVFEETSLRKGYIRLSVFALLKCLYVKKKTNFATVKKLSYTMCFLILICSARGSARGSNWLITRNSCINIYLNCRVDLLFVGRTSYTFLVGIFYYEILPLNN
jgi:hypothetical protein